MKTRVFFALVLLVLAGLLLVACSPDLVPVTNVMPVDLYDPTVTPVIPTGGTYENPVFSITGRCARYGYYTYEVRYSPTDLHIIEAGPSAMTVRPTCTTFADGYFSCAGQMNPLIPSPIDFTIVFDPGSGRTFTNVPADVPGCPAYVPETQLLSVTCEPGGKVSFVIDTGTMLATWYSACLGDEICSGPGSQYFSPDRRYSYTDMQVTFVGDAPTGSTPPLRFFTRLQGQSPDSDNYVVVFDDFYSRYLESCRNVIIAPVPTAEPGGGQPPVVACESYQVDEACKNGGCFWWFSDMACHADPEVHPVTCSNYTTEKECLNAPGGVCKWDGKVCY